MDMTDEIDLETMPFCPLCDDALGVEEPTIVITAHGMRALAHVICVEGVDAVSD